MPIEPDQTDIDTLLLIDAGKRPLIARAPAARLMLMGYLAPVEAGLAALAPARMEANGRIVHLRMTYRAVRLIALHRNRHIDNDVPPAGFTPLRRAGG
ncbi:hypothetical protein RKE25_14445 [Dyella sp. BiH032]|uniref:hypothetical protein n=1 Tax=Dyella sp. BiH032 TaxID=3075430 RepID=UPI0028937C39|nr:hypothetical protein [Dyella sp. BiH032]WNL44619.1 hypothetical protein RKE25_14445 [Dyella sp. BiH032]